MYASHGAAARHGGAARLLLGLAFVLLGLPAILGTCLTSCVAANHLTESDLRMMSRWEEGHIEEWSQISFPDGIVEWAESEFRRVKAKQVLIDRWSCCM